MSEVVNEYVSENDLQIVTAKDFKIYRLSENEHTRLEMQTLIVFVVEELETASEREEVTPATTEEDQEVGKEEIPAAVTAAVGALVHGGFGNITVRPRSEVPPSGDR